MRYSLSGVNTGSCGGKAMGKQSGCLLLGSVTRPLSQHEMPLWVGPVKKPILLINHKVQTRFDVKGNTAINYDQSFKKIKRIQNLF